MVLPSYRKYLAALWHSRGAPTLQTYSSAGHTLQKYSRGARTLQKYSRGCTLQKPETTSKAKNWSLQPSLNALNSKTLEVDWCCIAQVGVDKKFVAKFWRIWQWGRSKFLTCIIYIVYHWIISLSLRWASSDGVSLCWLVAGLNVLLVTQVT